MSTITVTSLQQLNALVARHVMSLNVDRISDPGSVPAFALIDGRFIPVPNYSTDLNAAVEVGIKEAFVVSLGSTTSVWYDESDVGMIDCEPLAKHSSPAIAICIAALKCAGVDVELKLEERE